MHALTHPSINLLTLSHISSHILSHPPIQPTHPPQAHLGKGAGNVLAAAAAAVPHTDGDGTDPPEGGGGESDGVTLPKTANSAAAARIRGMLQLLSSEAGFLVNAEVTQHILPVSSPTSHPRNNITSYLRQYQNSHHIFAIASQRTYLRNRYPYSNTYPLSPTPSLITYLSTQP